MVTACAIIKWAASNVGVAAAVVAAFAALITAVTAVWQVRESRRAIQAQVLDASFRQLREHEDRYYEKMPEPGSQEERNWCSGFFNTLEYMSFLVNEGIIPQKRFARFYRSAIINWYDTVFQEKATADQIKNPQRFPELKKLYKRLK